MPYPGLSLYPSSLTFPGTEGILPPLYDRWALIGGIVFNAEETGGVAWYLNGLEGWTGAPQGSLAPVQKPRQPGAWAGTSFSKGRTLVLSGTMIAPTPAQATDAMDRLNTAIPLSSQPLIVTENGVTRYAAVRRDGDIIDKWQSDVVVTFTVQMFAPDSRKLGDALIESTLLPQSSGGLTPPFTLPTTINSRVVSGVVSLTNPGNEIGPVVLQINGPCVGPQITHTGDGASLVFSSSISLAAGEFLTVDMNKHVTLGNGQANRATYITSRQWSGFEPGSNTWAFTAAAPNPAAQLVVTATPAWR